MATRNYFRKLAKSRDKLLSSLLKKLDKQVSKAEAGLLQSVLEDVTEKLELSESGNIKNTVYNRRLVSNVDTVFSKYMRTHGAEIAGVLAEGISEIANFNSRYFSTFDTKAKLAPINSQVIDSLKGWLGIEGNKVARNGYLDTIISDHRVIAQVKDLVMKSVVSQNGWFETKKQVGELLGTGELKGNSGKLKQYYRNFTYDLYSQADRTAAKITADKLGLEYAIYEGGLIETSREFCIEHNGKVYSKEEIAKFDPKEAKPPNYNPFIDLGGYGCRHHLNWIPKALAFALRPELRAMAA